MATFIEKVRNDEDAGTVFMPFNESQRDLVLDGKIKLTARTGKQAKRMGLGKGEEAFTLIRTGEEGERAAAFRVKCLGVASIEAIGLKEFKRVGLGGEEPSYRPTMLFMLGYTKASLYKLEKLDEDEVPSCLLEEDEDFVDTGSEDEPFTDPDELFTEEDAQALQEELPF